MPAVQYHIGRFPPEERLNWRKLVPHIGPAAAALARYDAVLAAIPNLDALLAPLAVREAVLSSRIEGTQATIWQVLESEAGLEPDLPARRADIHEVLNCRAAMRQAEKLLETLPFSQQLIRQAHEVLLTGVRGQGKSPGEYRRIPNWIGPPGCSIGEARFIPVEADRLPEAMDNWERYFHSGGHDRLIQLAVLHAEFEALHPFLGGNGRLGRMVVPLFLWQAGLIRFPMFHISAFLEAHRDAYFDGLISVSRDDDWTGWCQFFLCAIRMQAEDHLARTQRIIDLYNDMREHIVRLTRSHYAVFALDWIFETPIFRSADFVLQAAIPTPTAGRILRVFRDAGILEPILEARGRRSAVLAFRRLLEVIEDREVFRDSRHQEADFDDRFFEIMIDK